MHQTALSSYVQQVVRGYGGGGESPRQPIESPDSLRSIAYARIQDLISEGEIFGFAKPDKPLTCMFLNETPVANDDGTLNFKNVQIDSRVGTQTQDYMKGFDGVRNETAVGVELRQDTPWTRTFTNMNLNAVSVRLSTPLFQKTNTSNGDITGTSVYYMIQLSIDGGPFNTIMTSGFVGKTTTEYERGHRIDLPPATTSWTIRVQRITEDSTSGALANSTFIKAFTEIIDVKLRMPMSAYVGTIVDAEQFQQIPARAFHMKGRIIRVPSNYDPDTRTYTGLWDGTFQSRYSNNPAWVFYDMALNTRYGLGHLVPSQYMDKWALYRIAQYCDQLVDDGFGGTEPRFTCNVYLQTQNDALQVMQDLATVFRGIMYAAGGAIVPVCDMPEDATYTYTNANVDDGEFSYSGSAKKVRHTVALVSWNDMTDFCRAKVESIPDEEGIARYGVQETQVIAVGCTSRGQAYRFGRYLLATERAETDAVSFGVGLDGLRCAPGKIINVADRLRAGKRVGGRIVSATFDNVVLDSIPDATAGDKLIITTPEGVAAEYTIFSIVGAQVHVADGFAQIPVAQSVWAIETAELPITKYRVLGVAEKGEGKEGYTIHALKHAAWKFAFADTGIKLDSPPPIPPIVGSIVPSPQNLEVTTRNVVEQNLVAKAATLSWDAVPVASNYNVQWRSNEGSWIDAGNNSATTREIYGIPAGPFEIQVVAIDSLGRRSLPTFGGPYDVVTPDQPPGVIGDVRNEVEQEIQDRIQADFDVAAAAAADATAKAAAALSAAQVQIDVLNAQVGDITGADEWNNSTAYPVGDLVKWEGSLYRALVANTNVEPGTAPATWELVGAYDSLGEAVAASIQMGMVNASDIDAVASDLNAVVVRMPAGTGQVATASSVTALDTRVSVAEGAITSQGNAITVVQANLAGIGGDNLLPNSSFEDQATASRARHWTATSGGTGTSTGFVASFVASPLAASTNALRLEASALASTRYLEANFTIIDGMTRPKASPGQRHTLSVMARGTPGAEFRLYIQYFNASNTVIATATLPATPITDTFTRYTLTSAAAPAGTTQVSVYAGRLFGAAGDPARYLELDNIQLQEGVVATAYQPSVKLAADADAQAFTSLDARVTSVEGVNTAQGSAITAVQARLPAGTGLLATGESVSLLDTRLTAAEGAITANSSAITTVNARLLGNIGGNRLQNPNFVNGSNASWVGSHGADTSYSPRLGGYHLFATPGPSGRYLASLLTQQTWNIVNVGDVHTFSATVNCDGPWRLAIQYCNAGGSAIYETPAVNNASTAGQWQRVSITSAAAPAGSVYFTVVLYAENTTSHLRLYHPKMELGSFSTPYSEEEATRANATAVTSLDARVTTAEGAITATASALTSVRSTLGGGGNILPNSGFEADLQGWNHDNGTMPIALTSVRNDGNIGSGVEYIPPGTLAIMQRVIAVTPSLGTYGQEFSNAIPITGGNWYMVSAYCNVYRCIARVIIAFYDINGTYINEATSLDSIAPLYKPKLSDMTRLFAKLQAPSNAAFCRVILRMVGNGNPDPYIWWVRPMVEEVNAEKTSPSMWQQSGQGLDSKYASVTQSLQTQVTTAQSGVTTMFARYTLALDVNGYVSGIRSENTGSTSTFDILSDNFRILKPGGGARFEYSGGNGRVYDASNVLRVRWGVW